MQYDNGIWQCWNIMEKVGSFSLFPVLVEMPNASNVFP